MDDSMRLWVDADAVPAAVKEIIIRAALRRQVSASFVSDKYVPLPTSALLAYISVECGPDSADRYIIEAVEAGDLAITQDIPLAATLVAKGVVTIDPRGTLHTAGTVGERLSVRNFMTDLRGAGVITGGPAPFSQRDRQRFADCLDRELTRRLK
ncbi:putative DUF188 domain-containing protein YaiI [uncultured Gammaproteobacteria bacterium]